MDREVTKVEEIRELTGGQVTGMNMTGGKVSGWKLAGVGTT